MACLRRETAEGRSGDVQCNEEGCELRRFETEYPGDTYGYSSETDCVLQLRLRAGDATDAKQRVKEAIAHVSGVYAQLTPREQFESVFGSITDDQWQWLKEFVDRNYDFDDWLRTVVKYQVGDRIHYPSDIKNLRSAAD